MRKYSYLLSLFVALALTIFIVQKSHAVYDPNAKHSKWFHDSIVNDPTVKSTVEVKAQRTYPVSTLGADGKPIIQNKPQKSTIKLGASVSNVGKGLVRRTPAAAITYAVTALLGKAVDWVMDAENNRIKYKDPDAATGSPAGTKGGWYDPATKKYYASVDAIADALCASKGGFKAWDGAKPVGGKNYMYLGVFCHGGFVKFEYSPNHQLVHDAGTGSPEYQYIPIDTVAQQVIANADAGHAPSMEVMNNTALDMLEAGLLDAQLEAAAEPKQFEQGETDPTDPNAPTNPETPTDPTDPTPNPDAKPFELPPFCAWATKVCSFIDWMQAEPPEPPESGEVDVQIPDSNMHEGILERLYINMPAQCPPDPILEFMGAKIPFPMSVFCQFAEMMKPLILLFAYIKGLSIIGNGLT